MDIFASDPVSLPTLLGAAFAFASDIPKKS